MNLVLLDRHARERPGQPAIVEAARSVTFAELARDARRAAEAWHRDGLRRGDVVLVLAPMGIPLYTTLLGLFELGLVAMFVDPSFGRAHLDRCCELVRPKAFAGTRRARLLSWASRGVRRIPIRRGLGARLKPSRYVEPSRDVEPARSGEFEPSLRGEHTDPALITFTTGSTGVPKVAVRTEGFLLAQHRAISAALELRAGDVDLTTLPMFVLANLASGVTSVIPDADLRRPGGVDAGRRPADRALRRSPDRHLTGPFSTGSPGTVSRAARLDSLDASSQWRPGGHVANRQAAGGCAACTNHHNPPRWRSWLSE